ncbi:MAG: hypothetical protein CL671_09890 [Balneola sp.]|jgi:hypothetical protein|nr:hypothetical protein [Balneola sp.]MAO78550.1 hypothetical protein [Balneola sp.]MBF64915.1 hypothetical protein [Balneola sp.]HAW80837.1 hypothetical protein [Balneola sp.]|tara:strand:+ start:5467 stop:7746 length:2280 start_codon:yes stop_codon:yes gene_type:complete
MKKSLSSIFSIVILVFTATQDCSVKDWDYEQNPKLTYDLNHLDLDMTIDPVNETVKGVATYSISAKIPAQTEVILHAAALEIDAVTFDGNEKEFLVSGDSLIIDLADTLSMTNESELAITWQGRSIYGTHKDRFGTMWSSLNPKSQRHWLPVYDHPRVAFSVDADITIPANLDVVFNGNLVSDQVTSTETKTVSWKVDTAIPATGLNFAVGKFESSEAQSGINKVRVFGETGVVTGDEIQEILSEAIRSKRVLENELSFEYPWEALNVVILEDNFWDEKADAAGVIYLAKNRGALTTQLQRGLVAQWFGQYQRTENVTYQYEVFELIRKSAFNISGFESKEIGNSDSLFSLSKWNELSRCCEIEDPFLKNNIEQSLAGLIRKESGVVSGSFYKDHWYEQTGIPFHLIDFEADKEPETPDNQKLVYGLDLEYDEINSTIIAYFTSVSGSGEDLQSLNVTVFTFNDSTTSEVTFTGGRDSAKIDVPATVENVRFSSGSTDIAEIGFGRFPVMFLLAQLRSSNVEDRRLAASLLSYHTDNPDLQLALKDALNAETDVQTKANLLSTLGAFTAGATGTEIQFMQEVNSDHEEIQIAALKALANYKEDENVPGVIQQKMERTSSDEVFKVAKTSFLEVADLPRKISATRRLIQIDTTGARSLSLLKEIISTDTTTQSQQIAEELISFEFPYSTRIGALDLLLEHVEDGDYWGSKIVELSSDFDPRIRSKVLEGLKFLSETDAENIAEAVLLSEFDLRVLNGESD